MSNVKLNYLINYLINERDDIKNIEIPDNEEKQFLLYRSLVNIRPPKKATAKYLKTENDFLQEKITEKGIVDISNLKEIEKNIYLWKGDITRLKCGAIVNAANSKLLGCWHPCHNCIDNCIHTFSGVRLRYKCNEIMKAQGHNEFVGNAKITPSYNLPCEYIIHTVGPIIRDKLTKENENELENCYKSCLEIAVKYNIKSIAFCCISTGVFGYPQENAAETAIKTVKSFLALNNIDIEVIFNVFKEKDFEIYSRLLRQNI